MKRGCWWWRVHVSWWWCGWGIQALRPASPGPCASDPAPQSHPGELAVRSCGRAPAGAFGGPATSGDSGPGSPRPKPPARSAPPRPPAPLGLAAWPRHTHTVRLPFTRPGRDSARPRQPAPLGLAAAGGMRLRSAARPPRPALAAAGPRTDGPGRRRLKVSRECPVKMWSNTGPSVLKCQVQFDGGAETCMAPGASRANSQNTWSNK